MGSTGDKAKGLANEAIGKAKQGVGNLTNNDELKVKGAAQEVKGEAQQAQGKAKEALKDRIDEDETLQTRQSRERVQETLRKDKP